MIRERLTAKRQASGRNEDALFPHGFWTSTKEIRALRQVTHCSNKFKSSPDGYELPSVALKTDLTAVLEKTGRSNMLRLLQEETNRIGLNEKLLPQLCIQLPASAYASAHTVPSIQDSRSHGENRTTALLKRTALQMLQGVDAKGYFYKLGRAILDSFMMEAGHDEDGKTELSVDDFLNILFAKVLLFIITSLTYSKVQGNLESSCYTKTNVDAEHKSELELCFVQFYSTLDESKLSIDSEDRCLGCILLQ